MDWEQPWFPVLHFVEVVLPGLLPGFVLEILEDPDMREEGITFPDEHTIKIPQRTYDGCRNGDSRARFSLAHELGHLVLHGDQKIGLMRRSDIAVPRYRDSEWQANTFAAELLMPVRMFQQLTEAELGAVCKAFGVSTSAARIRGQMLSREGIL